MNSSEMEIDASILYTTEIGTQEEEEDGQDAPDGEYK